MSDGGASADPRVASRTAWLGPQMLRLAKKDVRPIYIVVDDAGRSIEPLRSSGSWAAATTTVDGRSIEMGGDPASVVELHVGAELVASAVRDGTAARFRLEMQSGPGGSPLDVNEANRKRFDATIGGTPVGSIELVGWAGRRIEVDLPEDVPIEVRLLAAFLAVRTWNKRASSRI